MRNAFSMSSQKQATMDNWPKITIITPSFNQGEYIEQTIRSVLDQNYPNLEFMIFDGGSTDNTVEVIKQYEDRLTYWVSEPDKGQSDAINKGLERATGNIINWLNSDDVLLPGSLEYIARNFDEKALAFTGRTELFRGDEKVKNAGPNFVNYDSLSHTLCKNYIEQPACFFRKSAIDEMGLLGSEFHFIMDKVWWIRFLLLFGVHRVQQTEEVLAGFRLHEASKTVSLNDRFYLEYAALLLSLSEQFSLKKEMELLKMMFPEVKRIDVSFSNLTRQLVKDMTRYFLLKRGKLVFSETDFTNGKAILNHYRSTDVVFEEERQWYQTLARQCSSSWLQFRIQRKINHLLGR